jgi:PBP1b-binding outer membrane lipoprotein LpoB
MSRELDAAMKTRLMAILCLLALPLCGCSHEEAPAPQRTPAQIQAQIEKTHNDPNIPDQAKGSIEASLQHEKELAQKSGK